MSEASVILNFHGIGTPHAGVDAAERPYWISREFFTDILDLVAGRPQVGWTFDDGNASDLEAAAMLEARGLNGEFFVLAGRFGPEHYLTRNRSSIRSGMTLGQVAAILDGREPALKTLRRMASTFVRRNLR